MWYVMQVVSGQENRTVLLIEKMVSKEIVESCFIPMRRLRKKYQGVWHEVREKLFPGYVFMITDHPQSLYEELKGIPALTKILGRWGEYFTPLSETDVQMIKKLKNKTLDSGISEVEISQIAVEEGEQIKILSGPLKNFKGQIRKINLHKRIAEVEMEFMGSKSVVYLGIEMVDKE
ncbi:antiterminator LoaP [Lachnospiraceae bacterium WCA-9-b2]|jgi:Transcription antiterminator|uniref:Antiterminator LoaP n=1 Tax=Sporofaciens musculi TaxID=2681861 RepID=A0A7X3SJQ6_9FIRM|nr:antiterminator LoaP [Sporofaciens musculi]MXP76813.1 antiterminator LoaP [Sporofaciens musculi]